MNIEPLKINAHFRKNGNPVSVLSAIISANGRKFLTFAKKTKYTEDDKDGVFRISDSQGANPDILFQAKNMNNAIESFFELKSLDLIIINDDVLEFDPTTAIERLGIDEKGNTIYNVGLIQSGHIAVLATCLFFLNTIRQENNSLIFSQIQSEVSSESHDCDSISRMFISV